MNLLRNQSNYANVCQYLWVYSVQSLQKDVDDIEGTAIEQQRIQERLGDVTAQANAIQAKIRETGLFYAATNPLLLVASFTFFNKVMEF